MPMADGQDLKQNNNNNNNNNKLSLDVCNGA